MREIVCRRFLLCLGSSLVSVLRSYRSSCFSLEKLQNNMLYIDFEVVGERIWPKYVYS